MLDLKDENIMVVLNVLGLVYAKITEPFWTMITTKSYAEVIKRLSTLHVDLKSFLDSDPMRLVDVTFHSLDP